MRFLVLVEFAPQPRENASIHMGVSENTGPSYSTLNSRILIIRTPKKQGTPNFRKVPYETSGDYSKPIGWVLSVWAGLLRCFYEDIYTGCFTILGAHVWGLRCAVEGLLLFCSWFGIIEDQGFSDHQGRWHEE